MSSAPEPARPVTKCTVDEQRDLVPRMMNHKERELERNARRIRRHEQEDAAGKLVQKVPSLATLSITVHEMRPDGCTNETRYIRRIVVAHAPALFHVPCSNPGCEDGGYDVTHEIMNGLISRRSQFEGQQSCRGRTNTGDCARVLRYVTAATYGAAPGTV